MRYFVIMDKTWIHHSISPLTSNEKAINVYFENLKKIREGIMKLEKSNVLSF